MEELCKSGRHKIDFATGKNLTRWNLKTRLGQCKECWKETHRIGARRAAFVIQTLINLKTASREQLLDLIRELEQKISKEREALAATQKNVEIRQRRDEQRRRREQIRIRRVEENIKAWQSKLKDVMDQYDIRLKSEGDSNISF